jgi:arylsulfatase A-like enzyme
VLAGPGPERALRDVAPTLLELLGEPVPPEMEGRSILGPAGPAREASEPSVSSDDSVTDTRTFSR